MEEHLKKYGAYWRREAREPGALERLTRVAVFRLKALDLVEIREDGIVPLPAIARYAIEGTRVSGVKDDPEQGLLF